MEEKSPLNKETEITKIKEIVDEIAYRQAIILKVIQNNHKITMIKLEKLQEYNEIEDMVNQVFESRITNIEEFLQDLDSKIA